ncbi:M2 family metallopeptidase [Novosphingobium flavum]|uniref:M2 family metallopeptidase n=1 Tax=Novosphingobium aerophilum TaxID=2839843 RepID=A0A7X1F8T8_9SPHN|nr:M2 family metallopeptidase [Novosphingobium aerophilum]MBC2652538.1 M2 family metallopeptidase [Novosphingobium aerophilum]MBC2662590.1 M2 family metallopeptidase [Novosphingobium aerophilum]
MSKFVSLVAVAAGLAVLPLSPARAADAPAASSPAPAPTVAEADAFVAKAEADFARVGVEGAQADWVYQTYITPDTEALTARAGAVTTALLVNSATAAARFAALPGLSYDTARKLSRMRTAIVLPAPASPGAAEEVATLQARMQGVYGKGRGTLRGQPINGSDIEAAMGTNRNPDELKEMWLSWHDNVGAPIKADYVRMVELANAGAKDLGYADTGALWRSNYDMTPEAFAALTDKLWAEVKPLYDQLHCFTRMKLNQKYGDAVQARTGPIRADLVGNMWAQEWGNIYDVVAPKGAGDLGFDVGDLLQAKGYDPVKMVKAGEGFYSSLGFAPLPATFWERSQITKPRDREVVCHASAWNLDNKDDLRIKMCTKVNGDDFVTIHHELGHNYYQRAYNKQSPLYLDGANDGFHEAIGDTMALSITPEYLVQIGLLDRAQVPSADKDIGLLLKQAMDKVAFLPFGLLIDRWRWQVFSGAVKPADYNKAWTEMRRTYQGIVPPGERGADAFDAGAKYHVPAVVPYTRYFLARLLQFQFYEAACQQAGWTGPLHRCSFYGNKAVGEKMSAMLSMGASKPWPEALEAFTGSREMSGKALLRYFAPLSKWLKERTKGQTCGW